MTQRVVHGLEPVNVQEQHRERLAATMRQGDRFGKPVVQEQAVRQAGQRVLYCARRDICRDTSSVAPTSRNTITAPDTFPSAS